MSRFIDQSFIKLLKNGDAVTVRLWFKEFYPILFKTTLTKINKKEDAEEIVQDTFINCLKNLHLFKAKSSLKTWMISILYHEIADYYRKKYAKKAIKTIPLGDFLLSHKFLDSHDISYQVKLVLAKMLKNKVELLYLKYVDKLKVKQIADIFGKSVKSIESELFRARQEFKFFYNSLE